MYILMYMYLDFGGPNVLGPGAGALLDPQGRACLQYADDTTLFMEDNLNEAKNMKLVLCAFEKFSGLKINFTKASCFVLERLREN